MYMYVMLGNEQGEMLRKGWREKQTERQAEREREREKERERADLFLVLCFLLLISEGLNLVENGWGLHTSSAASAQNIQHESCQTCSNCLAEEK